MQPPPPFPPFHVWNTYTQEQKDAFYANAKAIERRNGRFTIAWMALFAATIIAGLVSITVPWWPMIRLAFLT